MATSGTTAFNPSLGSLFLSAFGRIQVKRTELTATHIEDAKLECNYMQAAWSDAGVELWKQDLITFPMVTGQATYTVPPDTVMILDLYVSPNPGSPTFPNNRYLMPFSRTDYASLANPLSQGFPTSFFFLRTVAPTITFWPVPDNGTYQVSYWRYKQIEDATPVQGTNADLQYLFLDAYVAGLAHRLSRYYAPALEALRKVDATEAFDLAMKQNTENVPLYINPGLAGYFRP